jgi:AraC-like DNA-binding protein
LHEKQNRRASSETFTRRCRSGHHYFAALPSAWKKRTFRAIAESHLDGGDGSTKVSRVSHALHSAVSKPLLPRFIEDIQVVEPARGDSFQVHRLPDGRTTLAFRVMNEGRTADLWVAGPRTRAHFKNATGVVRVVILQFKPGWSAPLLGVAASALTDRMVPLEDIWGRAGGELCLELSATPTLPGVIDRLLHAIVPRARQTFEPASAKLARRAVLLLEGGEGRVEHVAAQLGVTARHLRHVFTESIGIGPKEFARSVRLQRAVRNAATSNDWASIAADAGYYDQAHLIADFRQLVGLTPCAFVKRVGTSQT